MRTLELKEEKQKKNFYLSKELNQRAESVAQVLRLNFSLVVRMALEDFVARFERERAEKEIIEALGSYAKQDLETAEEFDFTDVTT